MLSGREGRRVCERERKTINLFNLCTVESVNKICNVSLELLFPWKKQQQQQQQKALALKSFK